MEYTQDWLMRQISMLIRFIAKLIFNEDSIDYKIVDEINLTSTDILYNEIENLLKENKICQAEDLLFDNVDINNNGYLRLAIDFYQKLNKLDNETLIKNNFSREEINEGLTQILKKYNINNF